MSKNHLVASNKFMIDRWGIRPYAVFLCENVKGEIKISNPHLEIKKWTLGIQNPKDKLKTMLMVKGKAIPNQKQANNKTWNEFYHTIIPVIHEITNGQIYFVEESGALTPINAIPIVASS